jgi:hypothetical protein
VFPYAEWSERLLERWRNFFAKPLCENDGDDQVLHGQRDVCIFKMSDYDSDSSAGDNGPFTETNVLLGYPAWDETDDTTSRLGGLPVRMSGI